MSREGFADIMNDVKQHSSNEAVVSHAMNDMANMNQGTPVRAVEAPETAVEQPSGPQTSFAGELGALFREGLKDLQNAILPAFPDSQRGVEEPGTPLNPTQQMVTDQVVADRDPIQAAMGTQGGNEVIQESAKSFSIQDVLDSPPPPTPEVQQQERDMGREM